MDLHLCKFYKLKFYPMICSFVCQEIVVPFGQNWTWNMFPYILLSEHFNLDYWFKFLPFLCLRCPGVLFSSKFNLSGYITARPSNWTGQIFCYCPGHLWPFSATVLFTHWNNPDSLLNYLTIQKDLCQQHSLDYILLCRFYHYFLLNRQTILKDVEGKRFKYMCLLIPVFCVLVEALGPNAWTQLLYDRLQENV